MGERNEKREIWVIDWDIASKVFEGFRPVIPIQTREFLKHLGDEKLAKYQEITGKTLEAVIGIKHVEFLMEKLRE